MYYWWNNYVVVIVIRKYLDFKAIKIMIIIKNY